MPVKPELNVSGYRGIWGESLTLEIASDFARAFAVFTKNDTQTENPTLLITRDGRESGNEIKNKIIQILTEGGINIVDGDILPTPTTLFGVRNHNYDGAIIITASHNPQKYNGLKFVNKSALFTSKDEISKIKAHYENKTKLTSNTPGSLVANSSLAQEHVDHILSFVDLEKIKERKFKIAVDMINASACIVDPYLFERLGVDIVPLNDTPDGNFAHPPEPTQENLKDLGELVKTSGADLGFAHDPDADRLVVVNGDGEVILEEYTLALCIENILSKNKGGNVTVNLSTSRMNIDIAESHGGRCYLAKVGEGNVVDKIQETNSIIGGEGNGGVIYPTINLCRDGFVGIALILELLAQRNETISNLVEKLPRYYMKKEKMDIAGKNLEAIYQRLKEHFKEATVDETDGLRLDFPDKSWIQLRGSNTEPIIRLFGEAKTPDKIKDLIAETYLTLA